MHFEPDHKRNTFQGFPLSFISISLIQTLFNIGVVGITKSDFISQNY